MARLLVAVAVGPVQSFIAGARRTRDFWMGSIVLSECARAVARCVADDPGSGLSALIFPAPENRGDLEPIDFTPDRAGIDHRLDIANVVLFTADSVGPTTPSIVAKMKAAVDDTWRTLALRAVNACRGEIRPDVVALIDSGEMFARDRVVDFFAAWAPLDGCSYAETRRTVMRLLDGRKSCRNFERWDGIAGLPKSSLDGARETILKPSSKPRKGLRVRPREQLDLVGVVKRADWGHDSIRYPSVSRVAADPFIRGVRRAGTEVSTTFEKVKVACEGLAGLGVLQQRRAENVGRTENDFSKFPWLEAFPYEGTPLYITRHKELGADLLAERVAPSVSEHDVQPRAQAMLASIVHALRDIKGEPSPYFALIRADGDHMGRTLSDLSALVDGAEAHREFSRRQAAFAAAARALINGVGACVYASADDLLAFVPLDKAIDCASRLRRRFTESDLVGHGSPANEIEAPTLSIGIAIGHFMDPLEDLLDFAHEAERRAKTATAEELRRGQFDRDGIAVAVHARGGAPFTVRDNWTRNGVEPIAERLEKWASMDREGALSSKAAYDLRVVAHRYSGWLNGTDEERTRLGQAIRTDAIRTLARKRNDGVADQRPAVKRLLAGVGNHHDLEAVADELILGQWIAAAQAQAAGEGIVLTTQGGTLP